MWSVKGFDPGGIACQIPTGEYETSIGWVTELDLTEVSGMGRKFGKKNVF
jgi:hypothetical protein